MIHSQTCLNYAVPAHPSVPYSLWIEQRYKASLTPPRRYAICLAHVTNTYRFMPQEPYHPVIPTPSEMLSSIRCPINSLLILKVSIMAY